MTLEEVLTQEKLLQFTEFNNEQAFTLANLIIKEVKAKYSKPVAIRIVLDQLKILDFMMSGRTDNSWLTRKINTVYKSKHSSLYTFLKKEQNPIYQCWENDGNFAICGGGFPLIINAELRGVIAVSGLVHDQDHQVIVNALQTMLRIDI